MKPYGLPKTKDIEFPDIADGFNYALKASRVNLPRGKGKDTRTQFRSTEVKNQLRKIYKTKARNSSKKLIDKELQNLYEA